MEPLERGFKHRSGRVIFQGTQYSSGTISRKAIRLSQQVKQTKGYLEKLGLVSFHLKGNVWFMKIESAPLAPQLGKAHQSIPYLSLSPFVKEDLPANTQGTVKAEKTSSLPSAEELETKQQLENERDKLVSETVSALNLLKLSILRARPLGHESDKAKVDWGDSQ